MKPFSEEFVTRVKEVFTDYDASHLVDAGWSAYQQKQGAQKKSRALWIAMARVASVVLLLSVGVGVTYFFVSRQAPSNSTIEVLGETQPKLIEGKPQTPNDKINPRLSKPVLTQDKEDTDLAITKTSKPQREVIKSISEPVAVASVTSLQHKNLVADSTQQDSTHIQHLYSKIQVDSVSIEGLKENDILLAEQPVEFENDRTPTAGKKLTLYAGISGMVATVEHLISDAPGVSVGVYAKHKLAQNISFQTGIAVCKQDYSFQPIGNGGNDYMYESLFTSVDQNNLESTASSEDNRMEILSLEIPLNVVFTIHKTPKSHFYITTGASSLVFLDQKFSETVRHTYTNEVYDSFTGITSTQFYSQQIEVEDTFNAFSKANLFGLFNLMVGYSFPLPKGSLVSVEPFLQLPITETTSSNLKLAFAGISLKVQIRE
ncbi:MAG: hypothetical protein PHD00_01300 [Bacteroidales bacterium]|nr:hypothetical protein [Bacteroidales bacterium]MDD4671609.1 hypothetical protein [Bacteroidales bacterium]